MNKLLLNSDNINNLVIDSNTELIIDYSYSAKDINIIIEKDCLVNIYEFSKNCNNKIRIKLLENSRVFYNKIYKDSHDRLEINLEGNNSNIDIKSSCVSDEGTKLECFVRHNNKNTISKIINHGINKDNSELLFKIDAEISKSADNSITKQENKIINMKNGKSLILPNLIVDNQDVDASHSAYISDFDKEILFYMKTRGISEKECRELLMQGFLLGDIPEQFINKCNDILN